MNEFYLKYHKSVRSYVARKVDDPGVIEELVNDILMAGISALPTFNGRSSEFSWLCGIANHKIIDYYRKKKLKTVLFSTSTLFEEIADEALSPEKDVLKNELVREIEKTFKELGEGYSKVLRLKYIDGWPVKEMAKMLQSSVKAVESKLTRAKKKFRLAWVYDQKKARKNL